MDKLLAFRRSANFVILAGGPNLLSLPRGSSQAKRLGNTGLLDYFLDYTKIFWNRMWCISFHIFFTGFSQHLLNFNVVLIPTTLLVYLETVHKLCKTILTLSFALSPYSPTFYTIWANPLCLLLVLHKF